MKELSIEEKAKAYDEAIERARKIKNGEPINVPDGTLIPDAIFPELKESEDERIRKRLISYFRSQMEAYPKKDPEVLCTYNKWIVWLEKQGEMDMESYKTAEDEKREFVGDGFIKCYADFQDFKEGETYWLEYIGNDNYNVRSDNLLGKTYHITPCQLYTIFKKQTWLENQERTMHTKNSDDFIVKSEGLDEVEKYILSLVPSRSLDAIKVDAKSLRFLVEKEQKPTEWSEEDEKMLDGIIEASTHHCYLNITDINWLKFLKERYTWKPDSSMLICLEYAIKHINKDGDKRILSKLLEQLKQL